MTTIERAERPGVWRVGRQALFLLGDLLAPVECPGCGEPETTLCRDCAASLRSVPHFDEVMSERIGCPCWSGAEYAGVVPLVLRAWKEQGRHDLTGSLSAALAGLVRDVLAIARPGSSPGAGVPPNGRGRDDIPVLLVPVPSRRGARRSRGADLMLDLTRGASHRHRSQGGSPVRVTPVLTVSGRVRDQSGLTAAERHRNLVGRMTVPRLRASSVVGRQCLVVDDILTTGATVAEAVRTLSVAGANVLGVLTLCTTPLRSQVTHTYRCSREGPDWSSVDLT
jgi:predicted amidophosphoribosyltransferase